MATITIRNLDDEVAERLRARLRGVSVEQEVRRVPADGARVSRAEIAARVRARRMRERGPRYISTISEPIVVDTSIAFLWFANEPKRSGADGLPECEAPLLAPDLMDVEAANAWWKKLRRHEMERADVEQAITNLLARGIAWAPSAMLLPSAARLAVELGHPVYDCLYLALAVSHAASIATADKRRREAARRTGVRVKT